MNGELLAAAGQAGVFVLAGVGTMFSKRSKDRTEDGNEALVRIERRLERIDERVTAHDRILLRWTDDGR